jgi:hypothetical protein
MSCITRPSVVVARTARCFRGPLQPRSIFRTCNGSRSPPGSSALAAAQFDPSAPIAWYSVRAAHMERNKIVSRRRGWHMVASALILLICWQARAQFPPGLTKQPETTPAATPNSGQTTKKGEHQSASFGYSPGSGQSIAAVAALIRDLQIGAPKYQFMTPQLVALMSQNTGGTGRDMQLVALGPPQQIIPVDAQPLPYGFIQRFVVSFTPATFVWTMAYMSNGALAGFAFVPYTGTLPTRPPPADSGSQPAPKPIPTGTLPPPSKEESCARFPMLCT